MSITVENRDFQYSYYHLKRDHIVRKTAFVQNAVITDECQHFTAFTRKRERETEKETKRERERQREHKQREKKYGVDFHIRCWDKNIVKGSPPFCKRMKALYAKPKKVIL